MRYYNIQVNNSDGTSFATFTTFPNGATDLGALQVEIDAPVAPLAIPLQAAQITIWGVSLQQIGSAKDFNGKGIIVSAGMQKGLPLANPAQAGVIFQGVIWQAYGNWITTNQWVRFIVTAGPMDPDTPVPIVVNWQQGIQFSTALTNTIQSAFPSVSVTSTISPSLVLPQDETAVFGNLTQLSQYALLTSLSIMNSPLYAGVAVVLKQNNFIISDNTTSPTAVPVAYTDLIGQPTWLDIGTIQVTTVMRADLQPYGLITLPNTLTNYSPSDPRARLGDTSIFQGTFLIKKMRHVGNSRQPDATSWVTTMECIPQGTLTLG